MAMSPNVRGPLSWWMATPTTTRQTLYHVEHLRLGLRDTTAATGADTAAALG
ncbi:hypothetical protein ABZT04_43260 [Streptomyces sp. NPDC005492]|uniref:hypothetical protein n=1 Tax=Streptomyces sp. NPDC005492 TaxID=3156883 RepID=UPI0033A11990